VDGPAVELRGLRAGTPLEVVDEATGAGVVHLAKGAGHIGAAMGLGREVLQADWSAPLLMHF
jgi:hypothetical protein